MKKKSLSLKLAVLLLACGSFAAVQNLIGSETFAMQRDCDYFDMGVDLAQKIAKDGYRNGFDNLMKFRNAWDVHGTKANKSAYEIDKKYFEKRDEGFNVCSWSQTEQVTKDFYSYGILEKLVGCLSSKISRNCKTKEDGVLMKNVVKDILSANGCSGDFERLAWSVLDWSNLFKDPDYDRDEYSNPRNWVLDHHDRAFYGYGVEECIKTKKEFLNLLEEYGLTPKNLLEDAEEFVDKYKIEVFHPDQINCRPVVQAFASFVVEKHTK